MLLVVTLCPFVCALILFAYFFGRFAGEQDSAKLADAMRQMNCARIIPFPERKAREAEPPNLFHTVTDGETVNAVPACELLLFTSSHSREWRTRLRQKNSGMAKGTSA